MHNPNYQSYIMYNQRQQPQAQTTLHHWHQVYVNSNNNFSPSMQMHNVYAHPPPQAPPPHFNVYAAHRPYEIQHNYQPNVYTAFQPIQSPVPAQSHYPTTAVSYRIPPVNNYQTRQTRVQPRRDEVVNNHHFRETHHQHHQQQQGQQIPFSIEYRAETVNCPPKLPKTAPPVVSKKATRPARDEDEMIRDVQEFYFNKEIKPTVAVEEKKERLHDQTFHNKSKCGICYAARQYLMSPYHEDHDHKEYNMFSVALDNFEHSPKEDFRYAKITLPPSQDPTDPLNTIIVNVPIDPIDNNFDWREDFNNNQYEQYTRSLSVESKFGSFQNNNYSPLSSTSPVFLMCTACRDSGERPGIYFSHNMVDPKTGITNCPVLRDQKCTVSFLFMLVSIHI
jgi:hypothetical protein